VWDYGCVHKIEDITKAVVQELKEGSISFMIYAYPPMKTKIPKYDGGAAIKKRMNITHDQHNHDDDGTCLNVEGNLETGDNQGNIDESKAIDPPPIAKKQPDQLAKKMKIEP
jgi:hypothetical protein